MSTSLEDAFRTELPCPPAVAAVLASLAREHVAALAGSPEDSDEDLVLRLRDPRAFGAFAESVQGDRRVPEAVLAALLEHVFDLLPLPRTEGEVIAVEARAPRHLVALAVALADAEGLSVLHVMHLVYAVFLDRTLVTEAPRTSRTALLRAVLREAGSGEGIRVLYASLHLASVPEPEAASELRGIFKDGSIGLPVRRALAAVAAADDGGRARLTRMAQKEGLLPEDTAEDATLANLANVPRLPPRLSAPSRRFLGRSGPV